MVYAKWLIGNSLFVGGENGAPTPSLALCPLLGCYRTWGSDASKWREATFAVRYKLSKHSRWSVADLPIHVPIGVWVSWFCWFSRARAPKLVQGPGPKIGFPGPGPPNFPGPGPQNWCRALVFQGPGPKIGAGTGPGPRTRTICWGRGTSPGLGNPQNKKSTTRLAHVSNSS